jgi:hypothetical protein
MAAARRIEPTTMPWAGCLAVPRRVASHALTSVVRPHPSPPQQQNQRREAGNVRLDCFEIARIKVRRRGVEDRAYHFDADDQGQRKAKGKDDSDHAASNGTDHSFSYYRRWCPAARRPGLGGRLIRRPAAFPTSMIIP